MSIEILYIFASIVAISATVSQLRKILQIKSSDEFSLGTYFTWAGTQSVTLIYVISINNLLMILTNLVWVGYYLAMIGLILYYRQPTTAIETEPAYEPIAIENNDLTEPQPVSVQ